MTAGDTEKSQQCHNYFFHYSTFVSERPHSVLNMGCQTCFLPWVPSNLVRPLSGASTNHRLLSLMPIFAGSTSLYSRCMF